MRPVISRFADRIERQMSEVATFKGECGWHEATTTDLLRSAEGHLAALKRAHDMLTGGVTSSEMYEEVAHQAADAAAYLMMITDNVDMRRRKVVLV